MLKSISSFIHTFAKVLDSESAKCPKCKGPITQENIKKATEASKLKGFVTDIEKDTTDNKNFRKVLYTGKNSQLVLMSLEPGKEIGEETHEDVDQFFRVESGEGKVVINDKETEIKDGFAIVVPQGAKHNVINTGKDPLKLYSVYSPPHHLDMVIHKNKEDAEADKSDHFDGTTTEEGTGKEAFLPPHGYETLMKIRRPELKKQSPTLLEKSQKGEAEPLISGEEIEVFQDGKWIKTKVL